MKASMQYGLKAGWALGGLLLGLNSSALENKTVVPSEAGSPPVAEAPTAMSVRFSPGVGDVLKMLDAKVDVEVIKAYIKTSPVPYSPGAEEIIALKKRGVP